MKNRKKLYISLGMLTAFALWTAAVCLIDVQPIGPKASEVGMGSLNGAFHSLTGVHMTLYHITDWLGLVPVAACVGFAVLGLIQWIRRRRITKVDFSILILGGFYILVFAAYFLFEEVVVNRRPVLIQGVLEASYPSSTTLLVMCVMPAARLQLRDRLQNKRISTAVTVLIDGFTAFMVIGRMISGVHWLSDIIGGALLSTGMVYLYSYFSGWKRT